ncbi:MAG: glycine cleavage system protein GcvH [Myxococcales bacterium]|nr:glycine cleavage system protein GcvH [Myxococcales bacterium]
MSEIKTDRRYTSDHEWALTDGGLVRIGITAYAVEQLGDITLVNLDAAVGAELTAGAAFGTVESVKTLADLFSPISGTVVEVNAALADQPELVNDDCYGGAWMIAIAPTNPSEVEALLDAEAYGTLLSK